MRYGPNSAPARPCQQWYRWFTQADSDIPPTAMAINADTPIDISECTELRSALWDRGDTVMPAEELLHVYEDRWHYLEPERMGEHERRLLDALVRDVGNGVFLGR